MSLMTCYLLLSNRANFNNIAIQNKHMFGLPHTTCAHSIYSSELLAQYAWLTIYMTWRHLPVICVLILAENNTVGSMSFALCVFAGSMRVCVRNAAVSCCRQTLNYGNNGNDRWCCIFGYWYYLHIIFFQHWNLLAFNLNGKYIRRLAVASSVSFAEAQIIYRLELYVYFTVSATDKIDSITDYHRDKRKKVAII